MAAHEQINNLLSLLDCVHDADPCWFDHHGGCQAHGFLSLKPGEICPQREIADVLAEAEAAAMSALDGAAVCACLSDEQASQLAGQPKWSLPLCAVHPETRGEGEECSGRDDTGQASREDAAEQTVGTGYPQGSGPGDGSATPAPPSSRPGGAVHPEVER